MDDARVMLVMLRQPQRDDPNEMRTDPLWEFGSFGCTGCHRSNLMNPAKLSELHGARLGFAQNGPCGIKLVHITPPIVTLHHGSFGEAKWSPVEMLGLLRNSTIAGPKSAKPCATRRHGSC